MLGRVLTGLRGGQQSRGRQYVTPSTAPEDRALSGSYRSSIAASMHLYRNEPFTQSIVDVTGAYLGESKPQATTEDPEFNKEATDYFCNFWWPMADARRRPGMDYGAIQKTWDRVRWTMGDMLFILFDGGLLPIEGLQIQTPWEFNSDKNIINGVRVTKAAPRRITHFYVREGDNMIFQTGKQSFKRIRQSEAIFAPSENWRFSMMRALPDLHGVIDALQDWGKTNDDVQARIQLEARLTTIERKDALGHAAGSRISSVDSATGEQVEYTKAEYGMRIKLNGTGDVNKDFQIVQMTNPGSQHVPYMEYMGRAITAGCGFPYEVAMHLYTNGSYTANRAARCDFVTFIMNRWRWRNKVLNQPVWNWVIAKAMKAGDITRKAPIVNGRSTWHKCRWTLPHFKNIDEGKESTANARRWRMGDKSLADLAQEQSRTQEELLDAHDDDVREMKERAKELGVTLSEYAGELFKAAKGEAMPVNIEQ